MAKKPSRIRRTFTPQFKKDAVALVLGGRTVNEVAHDLGIARSLLQRWKTQLTREPDVPVAFPGAGRLAPQAEQLRQLQQRLRVVTEERDILKKAFLRSPRPEAAGLKAWAERIAVRRGKRVAVVALARRLAGVLYALWRDGSLYRGARPHPRERPGAAA